MLNIQSVTYIHPNRDLLFSDINFVINKHDKVALIGNNGTGKSTLLKLLAGKLHPTSGTIKADANTYYVPQLFGQFNNYTIAQAIQVEPKLNALKEILDGNVTDENMAILDNDWAIEERCLEAFSTWKLENLDLSQKLDTLSGGQKTKVFLAGIIIHRPQIVLLDEPSNHLDTVSREILYDYIQSTNNTLVVVSHDRTLLNLLGKIYELSQQGITVYGGNYDFYTEQKLIEQDTLNNDVRSAEKELRKAKKVEKEALERQQKLDARGKKKQEKAGIATIMMNTLRNKAEQSTSHMKNVHAAKVGGITQELSKLRATLPHIDKMKVNLQNSSLHTGKLLVGANDINFAYNGQMLWHNSLSFKISSGQRIVFSGTNGSGKTTLMKIILGQMQPTTGNIYRADNKSIYIDQDYSLINNNLSVYEQAQQFNSGALQEHDIKTRLNRFLFTKQHWDKPCKTLSGGEKMRLMLCALTISNQSPDIIVLDEPTNNLDIQNIEILTNAINEYKGTLLAISHDDYFLKQIAIEDTIVVN